MKTNITILLTFFLFLLLPAFILAQDIAVHNLIGKQKKDVIQKYGNPVHQDNSNPDMACMFYKTSEYSLIFVGSKEGIFQAEANVSYPSEDKARLIIDNFISESVSNGFTIDTVTVSDFEVHKKGVRADLQLIKNNITKRYDISIKARKSYD